MPDIDFSEVEGNSASIDNEEVIIRMDEIEDRFQNLQTGLLNDEMIHTIHYLLDKIKSNPQICFEFVAPLHFERLFSFLNDEHFQRAEILHFIFIFFQSYSHVLQFPEILQFYPTFFDSLSEAFSNLDLSNTDIENEFFYIITSLLFDDQSLELFLESTFLLKLKDQIKNENQAFLFSLKFIHFITSHRVSMPFLELTERFLDISANENEESLYALKIIRNLAQNDPLKIAKYTIDYNAPESCYLDDLCSFLRENLDKGIVALQILSQLTQAGEFFFDFLRKYNVLFEVRNAIQNPIKNDDEEHKMEDTAKYNQLVNESLLFYLNWMKNSGSFQGYLFDNLCHFDIARICEDIKYQVKMTLMDVLLYLSANAEPIQLHSLLTESLLYMLVANLDESQIEICRSILSFFNDIIGRCSTDTELLSKIANTFAEVAFDNNELLAGFAQLDHSLKTALNT